MKKISGSEKEDKERFGKKTKAAENGFDEEDFEDEADDDFDDDFDEEPSVNPKLMVAVFSALIVLAIIVCVLLWALTHKDSGSGDDAEETGTQIQTEETVESVPEEPTQALQETGEPVDSSQSAQDAGVTGESAQTGGEPSRTDGEPSQAAGEEPQNGAQQPDAAAEPISGNASSMQFTEVSDTVTSKDVTNLRTEPNTQDAENIIGQLKNGESLTRTGVNDSTGWSRVEYNGQTAYAVTQYLTTDLSYKPPVAPSNPNRITTQDGRVILFTDCDDNVTPKEYVNLRVEPSTSQGNATVSCQVSNGTTVHRTGYSPDSGWSRVEYNGQVLYVVSSMVYTVAEENGTTE